MVINIDLDVLVANGLDFNDYVVLYLLSREDYDALSTVIEGLPGYWHNQLWDLQEKQWLKVNGEDVPQDVVLRIRARELFNMPVSCEVEDWITEWLDLFPAGVKSGSYYVRSDAKDCLKRMRQFIKTYGYDHETIMKATERYVERFRRQNFKYIMMATYFIYHKEKGSMLATECAAYLQSRQKQEEVITPRFGEEVL